jgi:16S rRNA processing protein RimM
MEGYTAIGRLQKPHGLHGELKLRVDEPFLDPVEAAKVLFVEQGGRPLPFFVEHLRGQGALIVKLEEIDSREDAVLLSHKEVYLKSNTLEPVEQENEAEIMLRSLSGFLVIDEQLGELGPIARLEEYPQQWMAVLDSSGEEKLVPLVEAFIREIDPETKRIYMDLPEGLLEL